MNDNERKAPLPLHDRSWRHPSEIAQYERRRTFVDAPPLNRSIAFAASLCAVVVALVILGLSLPMSPRSENIATPSDHPTVSVRSGARIKNQALNTNAHYAVDGRVFTPVRLSSGTDTQQWQQFTTGTLFICLTNSAEESDLIHFITLRDAKNASIPVSLVARGSSSSVALYYSPRVSSATPSLLTPRLAASNDTSLGRRVSVLAQEPFLATIGLRSAQLNDIVFIPLDVGLNPSEVAPGTPVVNSSNHLIGLFTERNHASGFVPLIGAWTLVAPTSRALRSTTLP